jgi:F-type H+-transporting ATPase subunit epsilon
MVKMLQFDLVSPEKSLVSVQANEVNIPGSEGDFTAMSEHAPLITTLKPGFITIVTDEGSEQYFVTGGFAEVSAEGTSILAEHAFSKEDMTRSLADELISEANERRDQNATDSSTKYSSDLETALSIIS